MSFLSSFASTVGKSAATSYKQLQGPTGGKQSASETIDKLCDRLANGTLAEDRRAALLGLKGMSRDWKGVSRDILRFCSWSVLRRTRATRANVPLCRANL